MYVVKIMISVCLNPRSRKIISPPSGTAARRVFLSVAVGNGERRHPDPCTSPLFSLHSRPSMQQSRRFRRGMSLKFRHVEGSPHQETGSRPGFGVRVFHRDMLKSRQGL
jgi:hypothetical protein